jgi:protein-S-isoprenylcysteine O-methyltransferase Ste14
MKHNKLQKILGVGPRGAAISLTLLALFAWVDLMMGHPAILVNATPMKAVGALLVILGLGLHFWAFSTLRNWWVVDRLCTTGPSKYFRHPMYAAWITFVSSRVAMYFNSWIYFTWVLLLHPIWHNLVKKEEISMFDTFGDQYRDFATRTGRFIPRMTNRRRV